MEAADFDPVPHPLTWVRRAAIFPFNKEMHALVRFREQLSFDLAAVGDLLARGHIGRDPANVVGAGESGLRIVHKHDALFASADTLILGHLEQASEITQTDLCYRMASEALRRGMNVFSLASLTAYPGLRELSRRRGLKLYSPGVDDASYRAIRDGLNDPEPVPDVPVLGVFGTSQSQGKFTFQLALRYSLMRRGYRVGQIGTEPHAELFGCDSVFPTGYHARNEIALTKFVTYLECKFAQIVREVRPDIFLFGDQGPALSHYPGFPRRFSPRSQGRFVPAEVLTTILLAGLKPDAVILVVNNIDEPEHVARCVKAIESIASCKILAIAISDRKKEIRETYGRQWLRTTGYAEGELERTARRIELEQGIPVFCPTVDSGDALAEKVIEHFASFAPATGPS